jgi:hypothetical protein
LILPSLDRSSDSLYLLLIYLHFYTTLIFSAYLSSIACCNSFKLMEIPSHWDVNDTYRRAEEAQQQLQRPSATWADRSCGRHHIMRCLLQMDRQPTHPIVVFVVLFSTVDLCSAQNAIRRKAMRTQHFQPETNWADQFS